MKNVFEKIKYILIGVCVGMLSYLGIRTFSKRYRDVKKELRSVANELESIGISVRIAEELELGNEAQLAEIGFAIERERAIIESTESKLEDDTAIIESSENRIAECRELIEECNRILKEYNC